MSAEGVHVPSETHFLTRFPLARPLKSVAQWERALREVEEHARQDETPLEGLRNVASQIAHAQGRGHAQLLRAWLTAAARPFGAAWVGEASNVHTRDALTLAKLAPQAKLIHVIRDPRDVAASQREAWGASVTRAALRWRDELLTHKRALMSLSAERYRVVYYERLVSAPQEEIRALCGWFGWPFDEAMCSPHKRAHKGFAAREVHKERTLEPITPSRVGRWRRALSAQEARQVELICGPLMRELGYELSPPSLPLSLSALPPLTREAFEVAQSYATRRVKVELSGAKERLQGLLYHAIRPPEEPPK
jgi:hypothetical protein